MWTHFVCFERLLTLNGQQMVPEKYFSWNMKQNSSLLVFKTQQPESVWLWISKYNKIVKHGRSLYLKVEPLSSSSCLWSEIVFKDNWLFLNKKTCFLVFKTQQTESVWTSISKLNKIAMLGQSFYIKIFIKVFSLCLNLWSKNTIQG